MRLVLATDDPEAKALLKLSKNKGLPLKVVEVAFDAKSGLAPVPTP